ncbi:Na+/H+ antiporter subunit A [Nocardioides sp. Root140]|uniref:Na+/H+ antiporter subunit A n=1 Tax=Nocardioides sp. Root140 TaxID=1736460 RepID=UPI0006F7D3E6|nr:Na+/H+ antiporter subunit A [Nocardioides sp. Root140]KQY57141.1 cation:proton antiporter [Nocardioides sp. Root140]
MLALVAAHFALAALCPALVRFLGRRTFLVVAVVPLITFVWALSLTARVTDGETLTQDVEWLPSLHFDLALNLGVLQWLMTLIVSGIGVLVLAYCAWYFEDDDPSLGQFSGVFVAFAGAMLGLVLSDDLLLLYVFWELTTVFSYLLIGNDPARRASRLAAMQALIVTTLGGLAMLVGILMLGQLSGTHRASELVSHPPDGTVATVAVVLILVGALSKSALIPFHFWLPGAMAAPTPVSAYLHAASMVKAGVFLVALLAPAFADVPGWRATVLTLGVLTMLLGGWRALRQYDVKLLLAYGTVSQLGFLLVIFSVGTRNTALAGLAMLLAHALFKATLFLVVGIIDHNAGTRDLRELSGVARKMPVVFVAATVAAASMAGLPPLLGFVGKESVFGALVEDTNAAVVAGVVLGSVLTMAYSLRFMWGAFGTKPGVAETSVEPVAAGFAASPVILAALTLALGFLGPGLTHAFEPHLDQFPETDHHAELALWHGLELPLLLSAVAVGVGLLLFWKRRLFAQLQALTASTWSAERVYRAGMRAVDRSAVEVTGLTQRGSVAAYLAFILLVVLALPGAVMVINLTDDLDVVLWDSPAQGVVGALVVVAAIFTARSRRRLRAVILVGTTGYGTAMLFLLHGAPDLALTQILVETTSLVVFVLVLRRLPEYFTDRPLSGRRWLRMLLGLAVGLAVAGFMLLATNARSGDPVSVDYPEPALAYGGGHNIVSVILLDIRAWDTMGEISVLVAAATGVASLIFLDTRLSGIRRVREIPYPETVEKLPTSPGRRVWLPGPRTLSPDRRSIIFEVVTRLMFHTMVVLSIYLLFAGHNHVGGGFAAGMVTGLALMVRYLAGGRYELDEAAPVDAGILMGTGLFVATAAALAPIAFGGVVLQSAQIDFHLGPLGDPHLVTSVFFDLGVYLVVVGLILDLLRTFGSRLDRQILSEERAAESAAAGGVRL